jgi:hypothetical protein
MTCCRKGREEKSFHFPVTTVANFVELSPSWQAASNAATQELASILWNPNIHYRVHNSPPLVPNMSQTNPLHTSPLYLCKMLFNIVTDLMKALSGNSSVNSPTYLGCQQYSKKCFLCGRRRNSRLLLIGTGSANKLLQQYRLFSVGSVSSLYNDSLLLVLVQCSRSCR